MSPTRSKHISLRSQYELLPLGTRIEYHHRAAPARHQRAWARSKDFPRDEPPRGWMLKEGIYKSEPIPAGMGEGVQSHYGIGPDAEYVSIETEQREIDGSLCVTQQESYNLAVVFFNWPQARTRYSQYNKTVFVWPAQGFGIIIGMIRRGIGTSQPGYTSGYEYPEYNEGYFSADMYIDLYVVKEQYEGTDYILCPLWAAKEMTDD